MSTLLAVLLFFLVWACFAVVVFLLKLFLAQVAGEEESATLLILGTAVFSLLLTIAVFALGVLP